MARIAYEAPLAAPAAEVLPLLGDRDVMAEYAREIGATSWDLTVSPEGAALVTELLLTAPTAQIPAMFRRFVGPSVDINETRHWSPTAGGYAGPWNVRAEVGGRTAHVQGDVRLLGDSNGCRFVAGGDVSVRLGPLSGTAAGKIGDLIQYALRQQTATVARRLG